jgi:ankyrin repeat protein
MENKSQIRDSVLKEFHQACRQGLIDVVKSTLLAEAENVRILVDSPDEKGRTPLMRASAYGHVDVCKLLVEEFSADVNAAPAKNLNSGWTALMYASCHGHPTVVKYLISQDAKLDAQDIDDGNNALFAAIMNHHIEICQALTAADESLLSLPNKNGNTARELAQRLKILDQIHVQCS